MAQTATPYKVTLDLSDLERNIYEHLRFTVARHPSETAERLTARVLAYALFYHQDLQFGRGLSEAEEPALWQKSLDGQILHWIDLGQPEAERLIWSTRRAKHCTLLTYGNTSVWESRVLEGVKHLNNLNVLHLDKVILSFLATDLARTLEWSLLISEGSLFVSDARGQHELPLRWLLRASLDASLLSI